MTRLARRLLIDFFAGMALIGIVTADRESSDAAGEAYVWADLMIQARDKRPS